MSTAQMAATNETNQANDFAGIAIDIVTGLLAGVTLVVSVWLFNGSL